MNNSYALMAGINKYRDRTAWLAGCVNDVMDWSAVFTEAKMPEANMRILTDNMCAKGDMINGLTWLMGHSTKKHRLVVILDCCHAQTGTRGISALTITPKFVEYPGPALDELPVRRFGIRQDKISKPVASPKQKHVLIAACMSHQTAADAEFGGKPNGAFTWSMMGALGECGMDGKIHDIFLQSKLALREEEYDQIPVLEGPAAQREMKLIDDNVLYFIYSGHGSQVPCSDGDEYDRKDEILIPWDFDDWWSNPLSDDVLRGILKG